MSLQCCWPVCFESLALTAVHVVVSACVPANPSAVMLYCWSSYNSVRVIFEDETGTNTEESKVHDWVRHAICSHANSICGACEREMEGEQQGEESSSWQTVPTPFLCLSSVIIAAATGGHSLLLHRLEAICYSCAFVFVCVCACVDPYMCFSLFIDCSVSVIEISLECCEVCDLVCQRAYFCL